MTRQLKIFKRLLLLSFFLFVIICLLNKQYDFTSESDENELYGFWKTHPQEKNKNVDWYFRGGGKMPVTQYLRTSKLWPEESTEDRIVNQLMYMPPKSSDIKSIWVEDIESWGVVLGQGSFSECPVDRCTITKHKDSADVVVLKGRQHFYRYNVSSSQIWVLYILESPHNSGVSDKYLKYFNWTATYRLDSDIVAPYEKWVYYNNNIKQQNQRKNYSANKTKKVAWFVSNCHARNRRMEYARELQKYIQVDIYGRCGDLKCSRKNKFCEEMLQKDYKFYLSFENGNCRHYITEKFFINGLQNDVLPIVMGAHPNDYKYVAPIHSYIHVDDFPSAKDLANYLHLLDKDDNLYNSYFQWKGTGEFINTRFFCRLCAMINSNPTTRSYQDFPKWWRGPDTCRSDSWTL